MIRPKEPRLNSQSYRRWVASLRCIGCGISGLSQCAHSNQAKHGKGMARKASDLYTFPLCATDYGRSGCHVAHDQCIGITKAEREALENDYIERVHRIAQLAGRKEVPYDYSA